MALCRELPGVLGARQREVRPVSEVEVLSALAPCALSSKESQGPNSAKWDLYAK